MSKKAAQLKLNANAAVVYSMRELPTVKGAGVSFSLNLAKQ